MAVDGTRRIAKAVTKRTTLVSHRFSAAGLVRVTTNCVRAGSASVRATPETATMTSSAAYVRRNRRMRCPRRTMIALPSVRPPMKLDSTRLVAQTLLPNTRPLR